MTGAGRARAPRASLGRPEAARYARRVRAVAVVLVAIAVAATGCAGDEAAPPPSELTGLVVAVQGEGSDVRSFTLEVDGERYDIQIAPDRDYGFDLAHLREHQRDELPVRCRLEERGGALYAVAIEDA